MRARRLRRARRPRRASAASSRARGRPRRATGRASPTRRGRCRRRKPGPAAPAAARRLRVGDDDGAERCGLRRRATAATSLVEPMVAKYSTRAASGPSRARARSNASARSGGSAASDRLDLKADVHGGRRVRQRADRHVVRAVSRQLLDAIQRHAARNLDLGPALRARRTVSRMSAAPCCRPG